MNFVQYIIDLSIQLKMGSCTAHAAARIWQRTAFSPKSVEKSTTQ
jgi:hypothetical protein